MVHVDNDELLADPKDWVGINVFLSGGDEWTLHDFYGRSKAFYPGVQFK